jgi:hypothetical protein
MQVEAPGIWKTVTGNDAGGFPRSGAGTEPMGECVVGLTDGCTYPHRIAAAPLPTSVFNLSIWTPDFVPCIISVEYLPTC